MAVDMVANSDVIEQEARRKVIANLSLPKVLCENFDVTREKDRIVLRAKRL